MIGMAYACRHPGRVKRIIVCNTAAFLNPKGLALPWQLRLGRDSRLGALLIRGLNAFSLGAAALCALRRPMSPATRAAYLAPYDSWDNRRAVLRFVQDIPLGPGDRSYPVVKAVDEDLRLFQDTPMMLCWGGRDFVFDDRFLAEWVRRFPGAEVHRFADAGHYVIEDAGPEIAALLRRFLAAHPLDASPAAP
ncbi:MAG: alpha/beta fold hydrolase, partial [Elusimicrobiota bacterium]